MQGSKGAVSLQDARVKDQRRVERRARENKTKLYKEKAVRLKNSSCAVLEIVCHDGRFMEKVRNNDFSCNIERVDIDEEKLMLLSPRFHLNSSRNLLEKNLFEESARELMDTVLKGMENRLVSTEQKFMLKSKKRRQRAAAKRQLKLDTFLKHESL